MMASLKSRRKHLQCVAARTSLNIAYHIEQADTYLLRSHRFLRLGLGFGLGERRVVSRGICISGRLRGALLRSGLL